MPDNIVLFNLVALPFMLALLTLLGRSVCALLPFKIEPRAKLYLAPSFGLVGLVLISVPVGKHVGFGNSVLIGVVTFAAVALSVLTDKNKLQAAGHALVVSVFGLVTSASILMCLIRFGGFNAYNDTFTYLVHANWLQKNAFNMPVTLESVTPATTQIRLYQIADLRMGGSFAFGWIQALFGADWSYKVYPIVVALPVATCCLAIGFCASQVVRLRRGLILLGSALPALSFGGLNFGANMGFLPQTYGLAFATAFLGLLGSSLAAIEKGNLSPEHIGRIGLLLGGLLAACVYAYSEMVLFLICALLMCIGFSARTKTRKRHVALFAGSIAAVSAILLNFEIIRAIAAVSSQSKAVVGSVVEWPFLGFLAHSLGIHGGAWDPFTWSRLRWYKPEFLTGLSCLIALCLMLAKSRKLLVAGRGTRAMTPIAAVLLLFSIAFLYFRYVVPSPFPTGTGQSWSQFKLTDWAHPFVSVFLLIAISRYLQEKHLKLALRAAILLVFVVALNCNYILAKKRTESIWTDVGTSPSIYQSILAVRWAVMDHCHNEVVYLHLIEHHHKFRQLLAYMLHDMKLVADWTGDGYISVHMPATAQVGRPSSAGCLLLPMNEIPKNLRSSVKMQFGSFGLLSRDGPGAIITTSVKGGYDLETEGDNSWRWVKEKIEFATNSFNVSDVRSLRVAFEYSSTAPRKMILELKGIAEGRWVEFASDGMTPKRFDRVLDMPGEQLTRINIWADGEPKRLGPNDPREAKFLIRNFVVQPN